MFRRWRQYSLLFSVCTLCGCAVCAYNSLQPFPRSRLALFKIDNFIVAYAIFRMQMTTTTHTHTQHNERWLYGMLCIVWFVAILFHIPVRNHFSFFSFRFVHSFGVVCHFCFGIQCVGMIIILFRVLRGDSLQSMLLYASPMLLRMFWS